jgi:tetratricopeptide (TPR) repeat protein
MDDESVFSENFRVELVAAENADQPIAPLEALYRKFTRPSEQAEIELTIARILCNRTGFVDQAKSIQWFDKALARDLPPTVLAKQFILRGNMYEQLKLYDEALADYVRGLLICLQFNLPKSWPEETREGKLQPPPIRNVAGDRDEFQHAADLQQAADYRRERAAIKQEQALLMQRWYYVEAMKRIVKGRQLQTTLGETCEKLTNRQDRIDEVLRRAKDENPRPWP